MSNLPEEQSADQQPTAAIPEPAAPEPTAPAAAPAARPQPAFGEYAPEGWDWKPEGADAAPAAADAAATNAATPASTPTVAGVPHNLGAPNGGSRSGATVPSSAPAAPPAGSTGSGDPEPYRANAAPAAPVTFAAPGAATPNLRTGDRVMTVILLAIGLFGTFFTTQVLLGMNASFNMLGDAFGLADYEAPSWMSTFGQVGAIVIFTLYVFTVIMSVRRVRARKLTFWIPLTVGAVVSIAVIIVISVAITSSPELMEEAMKPGAQQTLYDYMNTIPK